MKKANEMVVVPTAELLSEMEALEIIGGNGGIAIDPQDNGNCGNCGCNSKCVKCTEVKALIMCGTGTYMVVGCGL